MPYAALPQIGADYKDALKGKIMLDATNAVPTRDGDAITREADTNGIGVTSQKYLAGTRLVRDAGFDPVLAGGLASARKFQQRSPGAYGFQGTAAELKAKLDAVP